MGNIRSFRELQVYEAAIQGAMEIFELTKAFPDEETYAMVDQMRWSSRFVCANIGERGADAGQRLTFAPNWAM